MQNIVMMCRIKEVDFYELACGPLFGIHVMPDYHGING